MSTGIVLALLFLALFAFTASAASLKQTVPSVTAAFCDGRGFGYHVGDEVCIAYTVRMPADTVFDFDMLPRIGDFISGGAWEIRDRIVEEVSFPEAAELRVRYVAQVFAVVSEAKEVPFGPFELYWSNEKSPDGHAINFKKLVLPASAPIVSPLVPPNYTVKNVRPMHPAIPESRWPLIRAFFIAAAAFIIGSTLLAARAILIEASRRTYSPLRQALAEFAALAKRPEAERPDAAVAIFRNALIRKFQLPGAALSRDVRERLLADEFWGGFADEIARLWGETDLALMENAPLDPAVVIRMQDIVRRLERREKDDPQVR